MNLGYTYAKYNQKIYFMGDGAELCYKSYYVINHTMKKSII